MTDGSYLHFQKKVLQFFCNFGNGVSSCCLRQSIKRRHILLTSETASIGNFPPNISATYGITKGPQLRLSVCLYTGRKVGVTSRIHQLHSYTMREHTSLIHDSNLTLSCRRYVFDHLNKNSGTSVNCHRAIAGYGCDLLGGKVYFLLLI